MARRGCEEGCERRWTETPGSRGYEEDLRVFLEEILKEHADLRQKSAVVINITEMQVKQTHSMVTR